MSLRWLTPGLALVVASLLSCDNQGKAVGPDVIDQLCELNREAVLALHSEDGMASENGTYSYTYCDYWVDSNDDGVPDKPEVQGSCLPLEDTDVPNIMADCRRNGARVIDRCAQEMQAMLTCLKTKRDQASSQIAFFTDNFDCWEDVNKNGSFNGDTFWTLPNDGTKPDYEVNHPETCNPCEFNGSCGSCGYRDVLDANGKPKIDLATGKVLRDLSDCYLVKELFSKGNERIRYNNVRITSQNVQDPKSGLSIATSQICTDEYLALNDCAKESELFLTTAKAAAASSGGAGAGGVGVQ